MIPSPSVAQLSTNLEAQLSAQLDTTFRLLPKAFVPVLAKTLAAFIVVLWKYVGFTSLQTWAKFASTQPLTINGETFVPLEEWGILLGVGPREAATRAELYVSIPVLDQSGTLDAGTILVRTETGWTYTTTQNVPLNASSVTVKIRAASSPGEGDGTGSGGNLAISDKLSLAQPIAKIGRVATVTSVVTTAANAQTWDSYRSEVLGRASARPQGGALADYRTWARTVAGIVTAYPETGDPGWVRVYAEATVESSGSADGIPTGPQLTAVATAIQLDVSGTATRRPVSARVQVLPIAREEFSVEIQGFTGSAGQRDQIEDAISAYYAEREPFIVGLSVLPRKDRCLETTLVGIVDELVQSFGVTCGPVIQFLDGLEAPSHTLSVGKKAKLTAVTWTA